MLREFRADLHIHTCLSPCGDLKMSPSAIAEQAREKELDIIGICDHNSAENVPAVQKAAKKLSICVLPGIEITSQEEIHILGLFDRIESAVELQELIYNNLPGENDENAFGMQVVVNEKDEVLHFNKRLLIGATLLSLENIIDKIHQIGGLAIASHVDRDAFSLVSQLGFIPDNLPLDAIEISKHTTYEKAKDMFGSRLPITQSSDAHFVEEIGTVTTTFFIQEGSLAEIKSAFQNEEGRKLLH